MHRNFGPAELAARNAPKICGFQSSTSLPSAVALPSGQGHYKKLNGNNHHEKCARFYLISEKKPMLIKTSEMIWWMRTHFSCKSKKKKKKRSQMWLHLVTPYKSHILQNHTFPDFILQPISSIRHQDKMTNQYCTGDLSVILLFGILW